MGLMQIIDKVTGQDDEKVRAGERGLILYSEFSNTSDQHKVLYEFVEKSGIALALAMRLQYNKFVILSGHNADSQDFISALKSMAAEPKIAEIDVIMHMHGSSNQMYFNDTKSSNELRSEIQKLGIGKKLRRRGSVVVMVTTVRAGPTAFLSVRKLWMKIDHGNKSAG